MPVCQAFFKPLQRVVQVVAMLSLVGCATTPQANPWLQAVGISLPVTVATFNGVEGVGRIEQRGGAYYLQAGPRTGWVALDTTEAPRVVDSGWQGDHLLLTLEHPAPRCAQANQLYVWPRSGEAAYHFNLDGCGPAAVTWRQGQWTAAVGEETRLAFDPEDSQLVAAEHPATVAAPTAAATAHPSTPRPRALGAQEQPSTKARRARSSDRPTAPEPAPRVFRPSGTDTPTAEPVAPRVIPWGQ